MQKIYDFFLPAVAGKTINTRGGDYEAGRTQPKRAHALEVMPCPLGCER